MTKPNGAILVELIWLAVLPLPVALVSWTVTKEELFREPRDWLARCSQESSEVWKRKLCYALTCDFCFSHYVAAAAVALTNYHLLLQDWRGSLIAWLAVVAMANVYLSAFSRLRVDIHKRRAETQNVESSNNSMHEAAGKPA